MKYVGYVAGMGGEKKAYRNLVGMPEGKRLLGRPAHSWENNIKLDLKEIVWEGGG
jgi:hypothetical protein